MIHKGLWVSLLTTPVMLASLGCSSGRHFSQTRFEGSPHQHQMAVAQSYERSGDFEKAKEVYGQILSKDPKSLDAKRRLEALVMAEQRLQAVAERDRHLPSEGPTLSEQIKQDRKSASGDSIASKKSVPEQDDAIVMTQGSDWTSRSKSKKPVETAALSETDKPRSDRRSDTTESNEFELPIHRLPAEDTPVAASEVADSQSPTSGNWDDSEPFQLPARKLVLRPAISPIALEPSSSEDLVAEVTDGEKEIASAESSADHSDVTDDKRRQLLDYLESDEPIQAEPAKTVARTDDSGLSKPEARVELVEPETKVQAQAPAAAIPFDATSSRLFGEYSPQIVAMVKANPQDIQPILERVVKDPSAEPCHRARAAFLLGTLGSRATESLPVLLKAMQQTSDTFLRIDIANAALEIHPGDRPTIDLIVKSLEDPNPRVQWWAVYSLRKCASAETTDVVAHLIGKIKTTDLRLKRMVFLTLAAYGSAAADAIPDLEAALEADDEDTRIVAEAALAIIAPQS